MVPAMATSIPKSWPAEMNSMISDSVMNSKVDFPSLTAVSTITTSAPQSAATSGRSMGEIEPTRAQSE